MKNPSIRQLRRGNQSTPLGLALGVALAHLSGLGVLSASAQEAKLDKIAQENLDLRSRLEVLEGVAKKEGILPSGDSKTKLVTAMSDITISGFVQASYFYNTRTPADGASDGYLWNTKDNSFAGFKASLLLGEDAPVLNSPGNNSSFNDLREAYVELNVPVGTGLNIKAGELISLLNYESGDGGAANVNFSQGNQWWFTGNGPSAGVQASYNLTEQVGLTLRVDNGLFQGPVDNNQGKAFSGSINYKPNTKFFANLYFFHDDEPGQTDVNGLGSIGGYQVTEQLGTGYEVDYFHTDATAVEADLWSVGGWVWYDFTSKVGVAFRGDFINSPDGVLGPAVRPGAGIGSSVFATDPDGDLSSLTLTLNYKPVASLKIQPEIRFDHTSFKGGLDGKKDRVIVGVGVTYLF